MKRDVDCEHENAFRLKGKKNIKHCPECKINFRDLGVSTKTRKKIKIFYNCWWLKLIGAVGLTIYPFVFIKYAKADVGSVLTHEMIHVGQIQKDGWFTFYFKYFMHYFINLFKFGFNLDRAYRNIPYEVEAYKMQGKG